MDIDRMAKEWPQMKRRLDALEQGGPRFEPQPATAFTPDRATEVEHAFESLRSDAQQLIVQMQDATAALDLAREALQAARKDAPDAKTEQVLGDIDGEVRADPHTDDTTASSAL